MDLRVRTAGSRTSQQAAEEVTCKALELPEKIPQQDSWPIH